MLEAQLLRTLEQALQKSIHIIAQQPIGGGCIHRAMRVETQYGTYFVKHNAPHQYQNFQAEADGLNTLANTNTLHIPKVIATAQSSWHACLVLEWIETKPPRPNFWEHFGEALARLHQHTQPSFGYKRDNFIGALPQRNSAHATWNDFFREERLMPMIGLAQQKGHLSINEAKRLERLFPKLDEIIPNEKPALLHGDLWHGNFLIDQYGLPALIDPAVYYGHREAELAFMHLFGGFEPQLFEAYQRALPLEPAWRSRIGVFNLYPLLVHLNLFGRAYWEEINAVLKNLSL